MVSHIAPNVPESVYAMFQLTFAIITAALVVGSFVERMKFSAMICFVALWTVLVYAPIAHWVWEPGGWLAQMGALDFAGGSVVHINAGIAGLVCAYFIGPRRGYGREPFEPYSLGLTMAGAGLLWVGWFGFNAGSAVAADGRAGLAMAVTHIAAAAGALSWMFAEWLVRARPSLLGLCSGVVAGLVAITPASGFVTPAPRCSSGRGRRGLLLGRHRPEAAAGRRRFARRLRRARHRRHRGLPAHRLLASKTVSGVEGSIVVQAISAGAVLAYSLVMTALLLLVTKLLVGLRVDEQSEQSGLDIAQHRERLGA
jgi:Amt family ammonium transporter